MNISGAASPVTMPCPKYGTYSTGDIVKSVVCKTAKYSFGLFMMPSMYLARAAYTVSTFAGRTVGFVAGISLGALVGTFYAINEGIKGSDFKTASKKITEYTVKGCDLGMSAGYLAFAVASTPLTLTAGLFGFVATASVIFKVPVVGAALIGASLGTSVAATCELVNRNRSHIDEVMNSVKASAHFKPAPEFSEQWSRLKLAISGNELI